MKVPPGGLALVCCAGLCVFPASLILGQTASPSPARLPSTVPPPNPAPTLAPLPVPPSERPAARFDRDEIQRLTPRIQVWRANSLQPQVPQRRGAVLDFVYATGTEPLTLRLQFDPRAAGERVVIVPAKGVVLNPANALPTITSAGECMVSVQLAEGFARGHIVVQVRGVATIVPIVRATPAKVAQQEAKTGARP